MEEGLSRRGALCGGLGGKLPVGEGLLLKGLDETCVWGAFCI